MITSILRHKFLAVAAFVAIVGIGAGAPVPVLAAPGSTDSTKADICAGVGLVDGSADCQETGGTTVQSVVATAVKLLSYVAGVAAVIMIIIAGVRYITSNGDPSGIKGAKDAIIYAIVGLIVVVFAQAIVKFVLNNATSSKDATTQIYKLKST